MYDSEPYTLIYVQKSSPHLDEDFLFVETYKFFTDKKVKYILRAEYYPENVFAIKYYASFQKKLKYKYHIKTNNGNAHKIILTCGALLPILLKKYPTASFAINGAFGVDFQNELAEKINKSQRYRIYSFFIDLKIGRKTFQHYVFEEVSSYLLVNKLDKSNLNIKKDRIRKMFLDFYRFEADL